MNVPKHIAIIMDGNGRWAKAKGKPRSYGHIKGCANLETICDDMKELGVKYCTVYAFSTENWKRSKEEIDGLMKLFRGYLKKCIKIAERNKMRVKIIGDIRAFDEADKLSRTKHFKVLRGYISAFPGIVIYKVSFCAEEKVSASVNSACSGYSNIVLLNGNNKMLATPFFVLTTPVLLIGIVGIVVVHVGACLEY